MKKRVGAFVAATTLIAGPLVGLSMTSSAVAAEGCPAALAKATAAVAKATAVKAPWDGPKTGPKATKGKTLTK